MAHWQRSSTRLLPTIRQNELENLYVFGYECKLFRDDEKATYIDQGRHLIPWMGDPTVDPTMMIDRYDGRGHLHDLQPHDADHVSHDGNQTEEEEQRIEALCDEERYLELHTDLVQKAMYEEEELKRLNEAISDGYSAVGFNYNIANAQPLEQEGTQDEEEEEEEPYYAPPELQLPVDVIPPSTVKLNAIIEKTAVFVSKQGSQMEIMIKTKQQNNSQFDFLQLGSVLNPYYKHMVKMLKAGKYKPSSLQRNRQNSSEDYLHPSLVNSSETQPVIKEQTREEFIHSVSSKLPSGQIENTLYAKLLSNIAKQTGRNSPKPVQTKAPRKRVTLVNRDYNDDVPSNVDSAHPQDVLHHNTSAHAYPNYGQPTAYEYHHDHYGSGPMQPPVPGMEPVHLPHHSDETNGQPLPPGTTRHTPTHTEVLSHPPAHQYPQPMHQPGPDPCLGPAAYQGVPAEHIVQGSVLQSSVVHGPRTLRTSIVDYPQDEPVLGPDILPPPPDLLPVIDKMAVYVAKNGPEFEMIVRKKQDERFSFLNTGHTYNAYYEHQKQEHQMEIAETQSFKEKKQQNQASDQDSDSSIDVASKSKHQSKAISFSLRSKEVENLPAALRTTALLYDSSEEDEGSSKEMGEAAPPAEWTQNLPRDSVSDPRLQSSDVQEKRQAEVRVKDRLALAARDRLAQASKENQIKAERKRKAAMFINLLKSVQPSDNGSDKPELSASANPAADSAQASPRPSGTVSPATSVPEAPTQQSSVCTAAPRSPSIPSPAHRRTRSPSLPQVITISASSSPKRRRSPKRRSRSPLKRRSSRSRSPRRRKPRDVTPPSAYHVTRRSVSPVRRRRSRSRSKTPARYKRIRRSRSKEKKSRTKRSMSRSRTRVKSPSRSRKRSRSRSKTKSKKKSRSRSRTRKRSTSRTKSKKSKSKKSSRSRSRSPKRKRSHDTKKSDKKSRSKHSSHKTSDKTGSTRVKGSKIKESKKREASPEDVVESPVVHHIEDSPSSSTPVHHDGGVISDSSSASSSPQREPHNQQVLSSDTSDNDISESPSASKYDLSTIQEEFMTTHSSPGKTSADFLTSGKSPRKTIAAEIATSHTSPGKPDPIAAPKVSLPMATRTPPPPTPKPVLKPPPAPSIDMFAE